MRNPKAPTPRPTPRNNPWAILTPPRYFGEGTWMEDESWCYPRGAKVRRAYAKDIATGKFKVIKVGLPDTFFSCEVAGGGVCFIQEGVLIVDTRVRDICRQLLLGLDSASSRPTGKPYVTSAEGRSDLKSLVTVLTVTDKFMFDKEAIEKLTGDIDLSELEEWLKPRLEAFPQLADLSYLLDRIWDHEI